VDDEIVLPLHVDRVLKGREAEMKVYVFLHCSHHVQGSITTLTLVSILNTKIRSPVINENPRGYIGALMTGKGTNQNPGNLKSLAERFTMDVDKLLEVCYA